MSVPRDDIIVDREQGTTNPALFSAVANMKNLEDLKICIDFFELDNEIEQERYE